MDNMQKLLDLVNEIQGTDIKMDEEFEIKEVEGVNYKFTLEGFWSDGRCRNSWFESSKIIKLISKKLNIIKPKWKPKLGERYFVSSLNYIARNKEVTWEDDDFDKDNYNNGMAFRTKEEAVSMSNKLIKYAKEIRENE